ncbi:WAT1-related protein [Hibiscus syriacus]|uniref:WAT1-related protein n=1 Tax=Hibiscus syriacus TaxID=106335 RepID=A0A6A3A9H7_HIBSY|nr:WAT1-related protein [Hibiscus syriacus]
MQSCSWSPRLHSMADNIELGYQWRRPGLYICDSSCCNNELPSRHHFFHFCLTTFKDQHSRMLPSRTSSVGETWIKGCLLMFLSNIFWGLWLVLQGLVLKSYPSKLLFTALRCLLSTFQSFAIAIGVERDPYQWRLGWNLRLVAVAYCGIVVTGVTYYLQAWVIEEKGPVFLAMSTPLNLIFTIFCSAILLCQIITAGSLFGGLLLIAGLYSVLWGKTREQRMTDDENRLPAHQVDKVTSPSLTIYGEICPHLRRFPSPSPAKSLTTIHGQKSLTIIQKKSTPRVFPDESIEKPNLHVGDLKKLFNKKDGFTRMNDVDVVRVCLRLLLYAGFLGREARQPIPHELILLVEDLNAWNLFPRGSYIWKSTWTKLSYAFDDRKCLRGDGSKYTLSGFVWAFKIWIFEAFPSMRIYALKTSNDIPRAISWKRKRLLDWEDLIPYATINNEANTPLMRLTPTEAELATDWWQASQRFLDGTNEQPPLPLREPSPHPEPSPDRPDYTPLQREPSPIPSHHRASSPPSPHDRRPAKMPRLLSPYSPPPRDESRELRDEVNALREEIGTLRDNNGAWRVEVSTLRGEVAGLHEMVVSL